MKKTGADESLLFSFCHKSQEVVGKLISTPSDPPKAYIGDECVEVCYALLQDDKAEHVPPMLRRTGGSQ